MAKIFEVYQNLAGPYFLPIPMRPMGILFIIFIISFICSNCLRKALSSASSFPAPLAIRALRAALIKSGLLRSWGSSN